MDNTLITLPQIIDVIYDTLRKEELYPEYVVIIGINWGDWKHEYLRVDYLMRTKFGLINSETIVTL